MTYNGAYRIFGTMHLIIFFDHKDVYVQFFFFIIRSDTTTTTSVYSILLCMRIMFTYGFALRRRRAEQGLVFEWVFLTLVHA